MKKKNDIYLLIAFLCLGLVLICVYYFSAGKGEMVAVKIDGKLTAEYDIHQDGEVELQGYAGGRLTLHIEAGYVWVTDATCPDKLCEHMGKKERVGSTIICLPNRISIELSGEPEIDAVVE